MLLQEKEAEYAQITAEMSSIQTEKGEMIERLGKADEELFKLRAKCRDADYTLNSKEEIIRELQLRLTAQPSEIPVAADPPTPVKVSSLGATKKPRSKGKGGKSANEPKPADETTSSDALVASLNAKILALEQEISSLNEQIARLAVLEDQITSFQEQIAANEQEKRTLQKRVDLLLSELESSDNKGID